MPSIKNRAQFLEPDPTNKLFPALTLDKHYEIVSEHCALRDGVPENVRNYFNTVVTLYLYGWLYYPFFTMAGFLSTFVVEMALRVRFPPKKLSKKGLDLRYIGTLLSEAKQAGLLRDEDFPSLKNHKAHSAELNRALGLPAASEAEEPYADRLIRWLPKVRNDFAHAKMESILPPGMTLTPLIQAAEIINQLWPNPKTP
jgi:hypothetical protein